MKGFIAWFARNAVLANVLMISVLLAGLVALRSVNQEVFPEFDARMISVTVPYRGAAPEEVEEAVVVRIEEAVEGLEGVGRIVSTASEGRGLVVIEVETGYDTREILDDVKARIDAISTFPVETEEPVVQEVLMRSQVINVSLYGDTDERTLKLLGEDVRDEIVALESVSQADLKSVRPYEIAIEVSEDALRRHGLTFDEVARAVRRSSLDLPGGSLHSGTGEILLRTEGQAYRGEEYESLPVLTRSDGSRVVLGDVARILDSFEESDQWSRFDGQPTAMIQVFRVGEENAPDVARAVREYVAGLAGRLPPGISVATWQDTSVLLDGRTEMLVRNGFQGLILVFIVLTLFLRMRLALWVALGIPVSFLGATATMPLTGMTINMMTLFSFILVLGIVVDDAIIVGERIHDRQRRYGKGVDDAIRGTEEVSIPVVFGVLTTMVAFSPLMMVPGVMGNFTRTIPLIVIPVLLFSLIESQFILPSHLARHHPGPPEARGNPLTRAWNGFFERFSIALDWLVRAIYAPLLRLAVDWRYVTVSLAVAILAITVSLVLGGVVDYVFFPEMDSDNIMVSLTMPEETPAEVTGQAVESIERAALDLGGELEAEYGFPVFTHVLSSVGEQPSANQGPAATNVTTALPYLGEVNVELVPGERRPLSSAELGARLRERLEPIAGAVELSMTTTLLTGAGDPIDIQVSGPAIEELREVAAEVRNRLRTYPGVIDIADSFRSGKPEIELAIRPGAEYLGLTLEDLGSQVRQGFFGEEAQRIQRGRDDVRVMVRYPAAERESIGDLERMRIRTPDGAGVPFLTVAEAQFGRGFSNIQRVDRQRAINVTAGVNESVANARTVLDQFESRHLPEILADHPRVAYSFQGQRKMETEFLDGLGIGFAIALFASFVLLTIPFRSSLQPLIVMSAVPFGIVGAVLGHVAIGMTVNFMSTLGMVAVAGVVVNDSLVLVHTVNRRVDQHGLLLLAVCEAGVMRFRPILLTSLTTVAGVTPLMLERSLQAQFVIPMAVAMASGVLFATMVTLLFVPSLYMILEDIRGLYDLGPGRGTVPDVTGPGPFRPRGRDAR